MATNYVQDGKALDYKASISIKSGEFLMIGIVAGIAKADIEKGEVGGVHITGIFRVPKANVAISQGTKLYWDANKGNLTSTASNSNPAGIAAEAAASDDSHIKILLNIGI
jgi:predicted RecA/RadA family phage recombinase